MELFIKRLCFFLGLVGSYFCINYLINASIIAKSFPKFDAETLIVGASDIQTAIDPKQLNSAVSIAQRGEPFYISYWKIDALLKENKIDTIILGCTHLNFSSVYDNIMSKQMKKWSKNFFRRIYSIKKMDQLATVDINKREFWFLKFQNMCLHPKFKHHHYIGGFEPHPSTKSNVHNSVESINMYYYVEGEQAKISQIAHEYLGKIIDLCKEKDVTLILVATPMHEEYLEKIPEVFMSNFAKVKSNLQQKGISMLDYTNTPFFDDDFFDSCHLNLSGAQKLSRKLGEDLKKIN